MSSNCLLWLSLPKEASNVAQHGAMRSIAECWDRKSRHPPVIPSECGTAALGCANESRDKAFAFAFDSAFVLDFSFAVAFEFN